jgi:LysM repeat protein
MTSDPSFFIKRIRHLSQALIISGALNIGVLSLLLYWILRERPPTPYCELKPAQEQVSLTDNRGSSEVVAQLSQLPFSELINRLSNPQIIEDGYAERDLALACLTAFYHFDVHRALPKNAQPQQRRLLSWKPKTGDAPINLVLYPNLSQQQFDSIVQFVKTERWPFTADGLFILLQGQKKRNEVNDNLVETFILTPEYWTVELLFNRSGQHLGKHEILSLILEGNWILLKQFVEQQKQLQDSSDACRQKFLLDYLKAGSPSAAILLLKMERDFTLKKLDDQQVVAILQLIPSSLPEGEPFAKEMLSSPRSTNVWKEASQWLYRRANEPVPEEWNYQAALIRFVPEKSNKEDTKLISPASLQPQQTKTAANPSPSKIEKKSKAAALKKGQPVKKSEKSASSASRSYIVQEGDSLWKVARRFNVKVEEIRTLNKMQSDDLKKGMALKIPPAADSSASKEKKKR